MTGSELRIQKLDRTSQRALTGWLADAERAGIDLDDVASIERAYEAHFDAVLDTPETQRADPTQVLTMIGMAMGEYVQRRSDVSWHVVTDTDGSDLALVGADEAGVLFPADLVADNWNAGQRGWLGEFAGHVVAQLGAEKA
ncbi:DUF3806 domain-containing protein [Dermatophilaceae bacterium Sec6.4]|nr:DUF3806 domain-containing protein [Actinomycetota bacterium]